MNALSSLRTLRTLVRALAPIALLALTAAPAAAQPAGEADAPRAGGTFGISLGAGHISCEDADGNDCSGSGDLPAGGVSLRGGVMLGARSSVSAELWAMRHSDDGGVITQGILAGVVRGWLVPRLWVQGGLGVARTSADFDLGLGTAHAETDVVPAAVVGVGVEVLSAPGFAIDIELKGGAGLYRDDLRVFNASLGAGVSFY